ncbi:hypothetical protein PPACK8108_LOCUS23126 [Phakopsora pachyrhizi]|uniref:Uncharacterized protein n=1 Tax=Phakopsora pachyrhizi TaxID=170000 RepID=A0AAV0BPB2_PHAPC|nr:hypothetical protein PPACK8108_LOCUS23126 [Phakopsora pachyrhizi]
MLLLKSLESENQFIIIIYSVLSYHGFLPRAFEAMREYLKPSWPVSDRFVRRGDPGDGVVKALSLIVSKNLQNQLFDWFKEQIDNQFRNVDLETKRMVLENQASEKCIHLSLINTCESAVDDIIILTLINYYRN